MATLAPATASAVPADLALLQGAWTTVAGPRDARFLIAGHRYTFEFIGGDIYMGTLDFVDEQMLMTVETGPAKHIGSTTRCLYQLAGGVLRWCPGSPGSERCPTTFPDVDDQRYLSLVFRRDGRSARR